MTLLLLLACKDDASVGPAESPPLGADDSGAEGDDSTPTGDDSAPADDTGPDEPPPTVVRFVALGDAGEGNTEQYAVADAMKSVCDRDGCDFALYMGDNFYDTGVKDVTDDQFQDKFELPYADLDFPFYTVLGNHDYGGEGIGWELWKGEIYVDYTNYSDKWTMPDLFYVHTHEHAAFYGLDSTQLFWGLLDEQQDWLSGAIAASADKTWKVAYAHHPYLSNGPHGNAGDYEGLSWIPYVNGAYIEEFMDESVCGQVDLYICGHDHDLQWLQDTCGGTQLIVSGAGAKTTDLEGDNPTWFEYDEEGFVWIELKDRTMTAVFYDASATELYRRSFTK